MAAGNRTANLVVGIYAWLAIAWWFIGGLTLVIVGSQQGAPPWPLLLAQAACIPVIPLVMFRGFDVLGLPLADWGLAPKHPPKSAAPLAIPIALVLLAGLCFFAWSVREEGLVRARVKEFVRSLSDKAHVLVDGEHFLGNRAQALLEPLAEMEAIVSPRASRAPPPAPGSSSCSTASDGWNSSSAGTASAAGSTGSIS